MKDAHRVAISDAVSAYKHALRTRKDAERVEQGLRDAINRALRLGVSVETLAENGVPFEEQSRATTT